jgi:hypothetical protein
MQKFNWPTSKIALRICQVFLLLGSVSLNDILYIYSIYHFTESKTASSKIRYYWHGQIKIDNYGLTIAAAYFCHPIALKGQ